MKTTQYCIRLATHSLLWICPALLLLASLLFLSQILPVYVGTSGYDLDPVYQYLLNGLLLLHGNAPQHVDHPGTPLQLWTAGTILVRWCLLKLFGFSPEGLYADVISQPEPYITTVSISLAILNSVANYYLGKRIYQATHQIALALFVQAFIFEFAAYAPRATHLGAESFLILGAMLLIGKLAPFIFNHELLKKEFTEREVKIVGVIAGFGLAVKMNFFPMLGLLFLLKDKKKISKAFVWFLGSYLLFLLPVIRRFGQIFHWVIDIASHSGRHGSGSAEWIQYDQISLQVKNLLSSFTLLYIAAALLILFIFYHTLQRLLSLQVKSVDVTAPLILLGVIGAQSALVIKHPGNHYMVPVLLLGFISIAWLLQQFNTSLRLNRLKHTLSFALLFYMAFIANASITQAHQQLRDSHIAQTQSYETIVAYLGKYPQKFVLGTYRCNLPQCAIAFGAQSANKLKSYYDKPLTGFGLFDIWSQQKPFKIFQSGEKRLSLSELKQGLIENTPIFIVTPVVYPELSQLDMELILQTPTQFLYRIK